MVNLKHSKVNTAHLAGVLPVLPVVAGSPSAWEPGSLGERHREFPALSRIIREPEGAWTPGRPRKAQEQGKGTRNSLYI